MLEAARDGDERNGRERREQRERSHHLTNLT
jgi:hypothetical protein